MCCQNLPDFSGGPVIGAAVAALREKLLPSADVALHVAATQVDFGPTSLNLTLQRLDNCTRTRYTSLFCVVVYFLFLLL